MDPMDIPSKVEGVGVGIFCLEGVSLLIDVRLAVGGRVGRA